MKRYSMKELKAGAEMVAQLVGVTYNEAVKIIAFFSSRGEWERVAEIIEDQNPETIKAGADSSGVKIKTPKPARDVKPKKGIPNNQVERVAGEIVEEVKIIPSDAFAGDLPRVIDDTIKDFCLVRGIEDLTKERQPMWRACCIYVGNNLFKRSKLLHDIEREKSHGGTVYDVDKVGAVAEIWSYLCACFGKAPFIDDFCTFAGVSDTWLYQRDGVTQTRADLLQKLAHWQEIGLAGLIVDGRQNPTAALACLNHWHGWTEHKTIYHVSEKSGERSALPSFEVPKIGGSVS